MVHYTPSAGSHFRLPVADYPSFLPWLRYGTLMVDDQWKGKGFVMLAGQHCTLPCIIGPYLKCQSISNYLMHIKDYFSHLMYVYDCVSLHIYFVVSVCIWLFTCFSIYFEISASCRNHCDHVHLIQFFCSIKLFLKVCVCSKFALWYISTQTSWSTKSCNHLINIFHFNSYWNLW